MLNFRPDILEKPKIQDLEFQINQIQHNKQLFFLMHCPKMMRAVTRDNIFLYITLSHFFIYVSDIFSKFLG